LKVLTSFLQERPSLKEGGLLSAPVLSVAEGESLFEGKSLSKRKMGVGTITDLSI
jgi:hypothetical protein